MPRDESYERRLTGLEPGVNCVEGVNCVPLPDISWGPCTGPRISDQITFYLIECPFHVDVAKLKVDGEEIAVPLKKNRMVLHTFVACAPPPPAADSVCKNYTVDVYQKVPKEEMIATLRDFGVMQSGVPVALRPLFSPDIDVYNVTVVAKEPLTLYASSADGYVGVYVYSNSKLERIFSNFQLIKCFSNVSKIIFRQI